DGLATGLGFCLALLALGALRELLGFGSLLRQADLMLGSWASALQVVLVKDYSGFLLALLPAGAFIGLGLLVAGKNWLNSRLQSRPVKSASQTLSAPASGQA
ncbi:MAG TPA: Rnf-Nqr domain containing protein, partial [Xanthomonadales bacterium]|nr:Rnf-Nqr domain containing protein [Xanthomonadales bacterium]